MTREEIATARKMALDLASGYSNRLPNRDAIIHTIEALCDEVARLLSILNREDEIERICREGLEP